jgi:(p)ppGpp synthase/HD superfamily hydrolase
MILSGRFQDALVWAVQLHSAQTRKGTSVPYIAHLLGVTSIALQYGADEDEAIGALLHDAGEDAGGVATLREIEQRFGCRVAGIVLGCTDTLEIPKPPWRQRKETYLAHLSDAPASVRLVSASDKLQNARTILADYYVLGEALWSRFTGRRDGTLWYYRALVEVLRAGGTTPLIEELARIVSELERVVAEEGSR